MKIGSARYFKREMICYELMWIVKCEKFLKIWNDSNKSWQTYENAFCFDYINAIKMLKKIKNIFKYLTNSSMSEMLLWNFVRDVKRIRSLCSLF